MGSWNKTCGISQFPIMSGDKVVTFIIVQGQFSLRENTPSYSNQMWNPILIPIYGEYNDYGWMEADEGQEHKLAFIKEFYKNNLIANEKEADRAKRCYPKLNGPFDSFDSLGDAIHGNVWFIKNSVGHYESAPEKRMMASFMIDRRVFDALTASVTRTYPKKHVYTKADIVAGLDKYAVYVDEQMAKLEMLRQADQSTMTAQEVADLCELAFSLIRLGNGASWDYTQQEFGKDSYGNAIAGAISFVGERGGEYANELPLSKLFREKIVTSEDVAGMYLLWRAMNVLRKSFFPQMGEGAQCGIEPEHKVMIKVMNEMIKFDKHRWD